MDMERLSPEIETTLYRIAQEALNNIVKHSQARHVAFMLDRRAAQVSLMIEDDGVGFNAEQVFEANDTGLGLIGMRERVTLVGGTIKIESQPGEGATVIVQIPVRATTRSGEIDE
jgi:signal transduction histidine kinase